jgi:hypothetical protein
MKQIHYSKKLLNFKKEYEAAEIADKQKIGEPTQSVLLKERGIISL